MHSKDRGLATGYCIAVSHPKPRTNERKVLHQPCAASQATDLLVLLACEGTEMGCSCMQVD